MMGRDNNDPAIFPFTIVLVFMRFFIVSIAVDTGLIVLKITIKTTDSKDQDRPRMRFRGGQEMMPSKGCWRCVAMRLA